MNKQYLNKNTNSISLSEAKVLSVLWQNHPLSAKHIAEKLTDESWTYVTIKTLINRLLKKGFLSFEKEGRQYLYSATITEKDYLKKENKSFVERMYAGSFSGLFAAFTQHEKISGQELKEIKKMISEMEKDS